MGFVFEQLLSVMIESKDGTKGVLYSKVLCFNYTVGKFNQELVVLWCNNEL